MSFCKNSRAYPLALLAARSKEALIHKSWRLRGPANKTVRLPGVRVEVFEVYLHWTGCGNFHMLKCCTQESELGARHAEQTLFIELYQLGTRLGTGRRASQWFCRFAFASDSAQPRRPPPVLLEVSFRDTTARAVLGFELRRR